MFSLANLAKENFGLALTQIYIYIFRVMCCAPQGRPRTTLPTTLDNDLQGVGKRLCNKQDLQHLRTFAEINGVSLARKLWKRHKRNWLASEATTGMCNWWWWWWWYIYIIYTSMGMNAFQIWYVLVSKRFSNVFGEPKINRIRIFAMFRTEYRDLPNTRRTTDQRSAVTRLSP